MYYEFYGMKEAPFNLSPDPRFLYLSETHEGALTQMYYGVRTGAGFVLVTGGIGTGKTTLVRSLFQKLPSNVRTSFLSHTILTAKGLLLNICRDFGIAFHARAGRIDLLFALEDFLLENLRQGDRALLVIDEAHHIKPSMLEEIRLLSNIETNQHKLLQVMLVGQPELGVTLAQTELRQLRERVGVYYQLKSLSRQETGQYINHRLQVAGCDPTARVFEPAAVEAIYDYTGGIPRLVNRICENALMISYVLQSHTVTAEHVFKAQLRESFGDESTPFSLTRDETEPAIRSAEDDTALLELLKEKAPRDGERSPASAIDGQDVFHKNSSADTPPLSSFALDEKLADSVTEAPVREKKPDQAAGSSQTTNVASSSRWFGVAGLLRRHHDMAVKRSKVGSIVVLLVSLVVLLLLGFVGVVWLLNKI